MLLQSASPVCASKYPIDINITISESSDGYQATVLPSGMGSRTFPINLTHHQIAEMHIMLRQRIEDVRRRCEDGEVLDEVLFQLAKTGRSAFNTIFEDGIPILSNVLKLMGTEKPITIEITSKNFFLPWELLYDGPLDKIDPSHFWGIQYILSRNIIQNERAGALVSPLIQSVCPKVGLITSDEETLPHVVGKEIPMLQELSQRGLILLSPLRPLDANQHYKELEYFIRFFFEEELQIAHIACHAFEQKPTSQSYLNIANDFCITIEDIRARKLVINCNPLVILNACLTGIVDSLSISGWASEFWKGGARGIVATEFQVPDWFAAAFVEKLYEHLLSGMPLGESLWATRIHFWKQLRNPLGLAYALYAPLAIRITK